MWKHDFTKVSLSVLFGLTAGSYGLLSAIAPDVAKAYTARIQLTITPNATDETFETMLRRAEALARAATQRSLDGDVLVTDVNVTIFVENYGLIAPVLGLKVTREQWQKYPDPRQWTSRYPAAASLLKFPLESQTVSNSPTTATPTTPTPPTSTTVPSAAPPPATVPTSPTSTQENGVNPPPPPPVTQP